MLNFTLLFHFVAFTLLFKWKYNLELTGELQRVRVKRLVILSFSVFIEDNYSFFYSFKQILHLELSPNYWLFLAAPKMKPTSNLHSQFTFMNEIASRFI